MTCLFLKASWSAYKNYARGLTTYVTSKDANPVFELPTMTLCRIDQNQWPVKSYNMTSLYDNQPSPREFILGYSLNR